MLCMRHAWMDIRHWKLQNPATLDWHFTRNISCPALPSHHVWSCKNATIFGSFCLLRPAQAELVSVWLFASLEEVGASLSENVMVLNGSGLSCIEDKSFSLLLLSFQSSSVMAFFLQMLISKVKRGAKMFLFLPLPVQGFIKQSSVFFLCHWRQIFFFIFHRTGLGVFLWSQNFIPNDLNFVVFFAAEVPLLKGQQAASRPPWCWQ